MGGGPPKKDYVICGWTLREKGIDFYNKFIGNTAISNDWFTDVLKDIEIKSGDKSTEVFKRYSKKKQQIMHSR